MAMSSPYMTSCLQVLLATKLIRFS